MDVKKEHSYTYWVKHDPNHPKIDCTPQKVTDQSNITEQTGVHSAWNTSGTWEEKKVDLTVIKQLLSQLVGKEVGKTKIESVESVQGEATLFMVRNKIKMGYNLQITYALQDGGQIKYTDFSDYGDRDYTLEDVNDEHIKHNIEELHDATKDCIESLKG